MNTIPPLSVDLIAELDKLYPLRNPRVGEDIRAIERRAGERDVVERLLALQARDSNKNPEAKLLNV